MSSSLVKKSLELFNEDVQNPQERKKKQKEKDPMKQISTKRKGVHKELRKLQRKKEYERQIKLRKQKTKSASVDVAKKNSVDNMGSNLYFIKKFSKFNSTSTEKADSIINHHKGKLSKNNPSEKVVEEPQRSVLFDDDEFDKEETVDDFWS